MTDPVRDEGLAADALRSESWPLRMELESHRVAALRWRQEAADLRAELEQARRASLGVGAPTPLQRLRRRIARPRAHPAPTPADAPEVPDDLDIDYYRERYSDLRDVDESDLIEHWLRWGRVEGRIGRSIAGSVTLGTAGAEGVLVVAEHTTGSSAADLVDGLVTAWRDRRTVTLLVSDASPSDPRRGEAVVVPEGVFRDAYEIRRAVAATLPEHLPGLAVLCGATSREFAGPLEEAGVPCVVLIQEFAEDVRPRGELANLVGSASRIVFPSDAVRRSVLREHVFMRGREVAVIRPGRRPRDAGGPTVDLPVGADEFVVVGEGRASARDGADLFVAVAAASTEATRFVWISDEPDDPLFEDLVRAQIRATAASGRVVIDHDRARNAAWRARADAVLDTSRLAEPVGRGFDAAAEGRPVIAFADCGGPAEELAASGLDDLVLSYGDVAGAAAVIDRLVREPERTAELRDALTRMGRSVLDPDRWVDRLVDLAASIEADIAQAVVDRRVIERSGTFDPDFYWGARGRRPEADEALSHYLYTSRLARPWHRPLAGLVARRGHAGLHALSWAEHHPDRVEDPLAAWSADGRPDGPWTHPVIRTAAGDRARAAAWDPRILVHGHFFFPDVLPDVLSRLAGLAVGADLVVTTDSEVKAEEARAAARASGWRDVRVVVVPNRGRDLGPLITALGVAAVDGYDLVLHVHGKRSAHAGDGAGEIWREFLLGSLISTGPGRPAIGDAIVARFASDEHLGLVFPEDPSLHGWDDNRALAEALLPRLGIGIELPEHFDFPQGGMFWARPGALEPLLASGLGWEDYPREPAAIDGTILHALERLLPFAAVSRGYGWATSAAAGVVR